MECNTQNYWHFGLFPSHGILKKTTEHNILETGSVSAPPSPTTLLGTLERANLNHWAANVSVNFFFKSLYSPCGPWPLFSFLIYSQSVGLLGQVICGNLPQCKTDNSHRVAVKHLHRHYPTSGNS
jgi:hypothetical protein